LILITHTPSDVIYDFLDLSAPPGASRCLYDLFVTGNNLAVLSGLLNQHASAAGREDIRAAMAEHLFQRLLSLSARISAVDDVPDAPPNTGKLTEILAVEPADSMFTGEIGNVTDLADRFARITDVFCGDEYDEVNITIRNAFFDYTKLGILNLVIAFS
jgi:hypothetical protein